MVEQKTVKLIENIGATLANYLRACSFLVYEDASSFNVTDKIMSYSYRIYGLKWTFMLIARIENEDITDISFIGSPISEPENFIYIQTNLLDLYNHYGMFYEQCINMVKGIRKHPFIAFYRACNNNESFYYGSYIMYYIKYHINKIILIADMHMNMFCIRLERQCRLIVDNIENWCNNTWEKIERKFRK